MGGLIKDFALTAFIIMLNHWIYGVEDNISYDFIVNLISRNRTLILSVSFLVSLTQLISAAMFESLGLYKITYGIGKILIRISQFLINFLAILNIVFYAALGQNLMRDHGYLLLLALAFILCSGVWSIRVIDFNYNSKNAILPFGMLSLMSIVLVEIIWPLTSF